MTRAAYEKELFHRVITSIEKYGGNDVVSSIILTGSFGRDEPTYTVNSDGSFLLKSDVEIALIFPKKKNKKAVDTLIHKVSQEFVEDLNLMPIGERRVLKAHNFNYSLRSPRYKTIFTYDLFNGSKTIWGRDYLKEVSISVKDVDPYEAKRLIANRIGELHCIGMTSHSDNEDYFRIQWKGKLMLALGSAWLILKKEYVSSYRGQLEKLRKLQHEANKEIGSDFFQEYEKVFSFLRENVQSYEISDSMLRSYVKNMDLLMAAQGIAKPKVNSCSRLMKYFMKYVKTGLQYGLTDFENQILQELISDYYGSRPGIYNTATVWHKVLY